MTQALSTPRSMAMALALVLLGTVSAAAQGLFSPAIKINDQVVTNYELNQRTLFLQVLRAPGNPRDRAREQLIEDRLKIQAARADGITVSESDIQSGMEEFAGRANLSSEEFIAALKQAGVDVQTFRDFVNAGLAWRGVLQSRFVSRAQVSEAEIDRALSGQAGRSSVRVLLSEIIMAAPPPEAQTVQARAADISRYTTEAEFAAAARRYSATATRGSGGKLPWRNLEELPAALRPLVLRLAPGEVTEPIPLQNAVALFQLRAIEETAYEPPGYAAIEYATYLIPGGRSENTLSQASAITSRVDTCDDLYGVAKGQPEERLRRETLSPDQIPTDVALELTKLDPGEVSTALTRAEGQMLMLIMLCGRSPVVEEQPDREAVISGLRNRRVQQLGESYLAELRADARIVILE